MATQIPLLGLIRWELGKYGGWDQKLPKKLVWYQVNMIENNHLLKLAPEFQPHEKRDTGRPRSWREQEHMKANNLRRTGHIALNLQRS